MNETEKLIRQILELVQTDQTIESAGIPVGVSNRHIHLSQEDLEVLFGKGYELTKLKDLKQPGQYASKETVTIAGRKGSFHNVRVLGPVRTSSQIEISKSDGFALGVKAPVRESGDLQNSGTLTVIGPKGSVIMKDKVIVAKRHIHMTPQDATVHGVKDKDVVWIKANSGRSAILGDVVVRVSDDFSLECHLDLDEANALSATNQCFVEIYRPNA